jgi:hypothetical protein
MPQAPPPTFRPFRMDPNQDPKENAHAFIDWVTEGIFRIHALSEANYRYSVAIHEALSRRVAPPVRGRRNGPAVRVVAPPPPQGPDLAQVLFQVSKAAVEHRETLRRFIGGFFRA